MRKFIFLTWCVLFSTNCFCAVKLGVYLGPTIPMGELYKFLNTGINVHTFLNTKVLLPFELSTGIAYHEKKTAPKIKLISIPLVLSYVKNFHLYNSYPVFFKTSLGVMFETISGLDIGISNYDPVFVLGLGTSLRKKRVSLLIKITYSFVFQRYINLAKYDGHFLSFNIGTYIFRY
ncbi:MAG: hypothetical protein N2555_03540 [Endomicrobia bacterium]|nr:hypothetical protein [Endomicrobiia bacterium]